MGNFIDLTGQKFGRLTVIERGENKQFQQTAWKCLCECGKTTVVRGADLRKGKTKSCGCFRSEYTAAKSTKHGMCETRIYREYVSIKDRCYRQKCRDYPDYGGRGITMCDEWRDSFETFYAWAVANGYNDDLTIDRIDNNGPYSPDNCRWATNTEQARNKRSTIFLEYNGERKSLPEWAEIIGIDANVLRRRVSLGWADEKIITTPLDRRYSNAT